MRHLTIETNAPQAKGEKLLALSASVKTIVHSLYLFLHGDSSASFVCCIALIGAHTGYHSISFDVVFSEQSITHSTLTHV